ncbi:transposon Ty3-I Gag-Pol polyprotein [Trichonephila clavipes]|nr:transposon Ty3-I Gag-Pol polyprotein [Trichonephila clavipes]
MTPLPQDTLVLRKLMTGFARDFTGRECTEMSFVPIPPAIAPFHRIGIDLLGRFPKSAHGNKWIIVCTDYSTRYAITKALPTAEVDEIAKFLLEEIVLRHGAPRVIITDRGAVFRSRLVSSLVDLCNIDHRFTTAYHPQTNGLTERFNKTLADMLSMYVDVEQKIGMKFYHL